MLGEGKLFDVFMEEVFNLPEVVLVVWAYEGDGLAVGSGSGRAAYAVDVVFYVAGDVEIDDEGDVVDVDASGYDVGGYEYVCLT